MTNRIVVGVLDPEQSDLLRRLTETAPIKLITSPILILSSPEDYVSDEALEFLDKKIEINTSTFFETYFVHNNSIEIKDKSTGEVITKKDENGTYDPVFNSGENLKFELQKMYR